MFYKTNSTDDYVDCSQFKQSVLDMLEPHCQEALTQVPSGEDWKKHREKVEYYRWTLEDDE